MTKSKTKLTRPADAFLPSALLLATLLGRDAIAFDLFLSYMLVRLCALSTANGLRAAFARQPAMRYVQGSACVALLLQCVGGGLALPLGRALHIPSALIACGWLLNIEHIFYEYLFAVGDGGSATLVHGLAAGLACTGLLLGCPPWWGLGNPSVFSLLPPLVACGLAALVGLSVSLALGGGFRPKLNGEPLRRAPRALLEAGLWPSLYVLALLFAPPTLDLRTNLPLFIGLILIALCSAPFRRSPSEAGPMNRALLVANAVALLALIPFLAGLSFPRENRLLNDIPYTLAAIPMASMCAMILYGNIQKRREYV